MESNWRKSSYSGDQGNCIEVAGDDGRVLSAYSLVLRVTRQR
jgi:hypothetical protein